MGRLFRRGCFALLFTAFGAGLGVRYYTDFGPLRTSV